MQRRSRCCACAATTDAQQDRAARREERWTHITQAHPHLVPSSIAMNSKRAVALVALTVAAISVAATPIRPELLSALVWRNVGPFRGGRISAVSGVIGEPGTLYIGLPAGG